MTKTGEYEPLKFTVEKMVGSKEAIVGLFEVASDLINFSKCKQFELKMEFKEIPSEEQ